jgi:hypothetical protein
MAFDFKKVLDFINPTYAQLKGLLLASVGTIGMVWFVSSKTTEFRAQTKETNELTKQNTELIKDIQNQIVENRNETKQDINKLYLDILDMNSRNNTFLNSKFNLLINYGNTNKSILSDMMKSLDEQQKLYEQDRLKNREYEPNISVTKNSPPDTTTYNGSIIVKPVPPYDKPGVRKDSATNNTSNKIKK